MRRRIALLGWVIAAPLAAGQAAFIDVAGPAGVTNPSFGRGSAWVDLDGDERLDLVNANGGSANRVYQQQPDHTFQDVSDAWLGAQAPPAVSWGVLAADFDNDGDDDLFFANGGFDAGTDRIYRNDFDGGSATLTDVTGQAGDIGVSARASFGCTAIDYDRDGRLDIFVNHAESTGGGGALYRNLGSMIFHDVTQAAGIPTSHGNGRHCGIIDFNEDGLWDIVAGHSGYDTQLFRNNGDGTFTDVAVQAGITAHGTALAHFGAVADDFDNDGLMDLLIPIHNTTTNVPTPIYLNQGGGTFLNVSPGTGMGLQRDMGYTTGDLDADGYPEFWSGTGGPKADGLLPNVLYRTRPNGSGGLLIQDVTQAWGLDAGGPSRSHGSPLADYDEDGDIDFYQNDGGPQSNPETIESNSLWQNQGNDHRWLKVDLEGRLSNRTAVGARLTVHAQSGRQFHRWLSVGKGFSNTDSHTVHFGLEDESAVTRLEIRWPSGVRQTVHLPQLETTRRVEEAGLFLDAPLTVGAPSGLSLCGRPGAAMTLLLSQTPGNVYVPQVQGTLEVGLPVAVLGTVPLPADGVATLDFTVPNDPSLSGQTWYLQGLQTGPQALLTDAIPLTVY